MENMEKVYDVLKSAGEPLKPGEVAEKSGIDRKEVDKMIKALVKEGRVNSPKRCFYGIVE